MTLVPRERPRLGGSLVRGALARALLAERGIDAPAIIEACPVMILANRGYYRDTMGRPSVNDVGTFDDAAWIVDPTHVYPHNWNCDPSRTGWNPGVSKFFAELQAGVWPLRQGPHRGRPNHLRQMTDEEAIAAGLGRFFHDERRWGEFRVRRVHADGTGEVESGYQAINVHEGSEHGTSSWGCQTVPPAQWPEFWAQLAASLDVYGQRWGDTARGWVPYVLTEERLG